MSMTQGEIDNTPEELRVEQVIGDEWISPPDQSVSQMG